MGWTLKLASAASLSSQQVLYASCANRCLLLALSNNEVIRVVDDDIQVIRFPAQEGKRLAHRVSKVFQDPNGFHGIVAMENGDSWYVCLSNCQATPLKCLNGYLVEAIAWQEDTKEGSPHYMIMGTMSGHVLKASLLTVTVLRELPQMVVVDIAFRQTRGSLALLVTTAHEMFFFAGPTWDHLSKISVRESRVFDVPRGTRGGTGGLQIEWGMRQGAWLTGGGTLLFTVNEQGRPNKSTVVPFVDLGEGYSLISNLLRTPAEIPKSLATTEYHLLLLLPQSIQVISKVNHTLIAKIPINQSRFGIPRRLVHDPVGERIYLITDQRVVEVCNDNELGDVWSLFLQRREFDKACELAPKGSQDVVRIAHAEYLCAEGDYLKAARMFACADYSFERACLKLMEQPNNERALVEYLRERSEQRGEGRLGSDTIPDVMLCLWGIELSAQLDTNEFLHYFLGKATRLNIATAVYQLLRSTRRETELLWFAEQISDTATMIEQCVLHQDFKAAIGHLEKHHDAASLQKYFPLLFYHEPHNIVSVLVKRPVQLDVDVPACLTNPTPEHRSEAIRYLEYCLRTSVSPLVCNALTWMYSMGSEDALMKFLHANENGSLDPAFALRVCRQRHGRAEVLCYGFMGLYEQAVALSLDRDDVSLAKHNASKAEPEIRRKLWFDIVAYLTKKKYPGEGLLALCAESDLDVKDMLPYLSDEMSVSVFRDDLVRCLEQYEEKIVQRRLEMMDHRRAATLLKQDLANAAQGCIVVPGDAICDLCCRLAMREVFVAFSCGHCVHAMCGSNLGLLLDDCPLCGSIMQEAITKPFWKLPHDEVEKKSWDIGC